MKIGILTYHRVINPGSVIQAWCVVQLAKEMFPGAEVEVIDYRPMRMELRELRKYVARRFPIVNRSHIAKTRSIRRFVNSALPTGTTSLTSDNPLKAADWIDAQGYDAILVGSDTVWELRDGAYSPEGANAYFLPFHTKARKVSIAASMDPVPEFSDRQLDVLRERVKWIADFDVVTVRDEATRDVLVAQGIRSDDVELVADPTLLVDWSCLLSVSPNVRTGRKRVCGVALPKRIAPSVHRAVAKLGYEVWDWNGVASADASYSLPSGLPLEERQRLYQEADAFVTDRFHGSIFSILLGEANVLFYEDPSKWVRADSKGRSLLRRAGIEQSVVREMDRLSDPAFLADKLAGDTGVGAREHLLAFGRQSRERIGERVRAR